MELPLFYNHRPVAMIAADERGAHLTYAESWLGATYRFPVSLTMPLGYDSYRDERLPPWLMNLLPEGEPLRAMTRVAILKVGGGC